MDLDITTKFINNNQGNNYLYIHALKNKFEAEKTTETTAFSPPKFNIPLLKLPESTSLEKENHNKRADEKNILPNIPATQLNTFLLKQLQERSAKNDLGKNPTEFVLPHLQSSTHNNKSTVKFELPVLKTPATVNKVRPQENSNDRELQSISHKTANIDLTTALVNKLQGHQSTPPNKDFNKLQQNSEELEFEIPFIDCDRLDAKKHRLFSTTPNEYCITDVSKLLLQLPLAEPSSIGRFLCIDDNKYLAPLPLKCLAPEYRHQQIVKYNIEPFRFETKSPDDLVLLALNKYQRRHYN